MTTMETLSAQWLTTLEMENMDLSQYNGTPFPGPDQPATSMGNLSDENLSFDNSLPSFGDMTSAEAPYVEFSEYHVGSRIPAGIKCFERPMKIPRTNPWSSFAAGQSVSSFYSSNVPTGQQNTQSVKIDYSANHQKAKDERYEVFAPKTPAMQGELLISNTSSTTDILSSENVSMRKFYMDTSMASSRKTANVTGRISSNHTKDHIIAERKRRERLSQKFIALSAIIPGLKKMDKASVLEDAIEYVKKLQEKISVLEQEAPKKTTQSVVYVNKSHMPCVNNTQSESGISEGNKKDEKRVLTPEIEARVVGKNVLIRVHCVKRKGLLVKSLGELEKMQMTVVNASSFSFSETALDLTLITQMEDGCNLTGPEIVKSLEEFFNSNNSNN